MKSIFIPLKLDAANDPGAGGGGGNSTTTQTTQTQQPSEAEKEKERLLTENADLRKKQKDAETKAQQALDEIAALKKAGNKTTGDWQKVAEQLEGEVTTLKERNSKLTGAFKNTLVSSKLREEALKAGAKADMVDLIDSMEFDEIEFNLDEENLKFGIKGVDTAMANLKKLRPSFFGEVQPPKFNKGGPSTPGKPQGLEDAKQKYVAAMKLRHKDPVAFSAATKAYQEAIFEARKAKK